MRNVNLLVEDRGHKAFLGALLARLANHYGIYVDIRFLSAHGGQGTVIRELKKYIRDLQQGKETIPDLLIVATDGNCKGFSGRKQEIDNAMKGFSGQIIYAIPDPHIERWLLLDSAAFKKVLGKGCSAPIQKCERDLYKRLLMDAVRNTGKKTLLDGIEHTEDLVNAMNLDYLERTEESLGKLLKTLRHKFQEWAQAEHGEPPILRENPIAYVLQTEFENPQP